MIGYLEAIVADRRRDIRGERELVATETLQQMAMERTAVRDFTKSIRTGGSPAIIAEIKRRSPSAGLLDAQTDAGGIAAQYERGGAAAISVVTEPRRFGGRFLDIARVRRASTLPVLCKDFIFDDFQVWKAAAFGADAVLLIAAILDDARLGSIMELAASLGMASLVEIHDETEAERMAAIGCPLVGINNRNLATFEVDPRTTERLVGVVSNGSLIVAESGYTTRQQLHDAARCGVDAVLVGEHLMRAVDRAEALQLLSGVACFQ